MIAAGQAEEQIVEQLTKDLYNRSTGCQYWHVFVNVGDAVVSHRTLDLDDDDLDLNKGHMILKVLVHFDGGSGPAHNVTIAETIAAMRLDPINLSL